MSSMPKPWKMRTGAFLRLIANYLDERDLENHAAKQLKRRYNVLDTTKTMTHIKAAVLNPQYPYKNMLMRQGRDRELWVLTHAKTNYYFIWAKETKAFVTFLTPDMAHKKLNAMEKNIKRLREKFSK